MSNDINLSVDIELHFNDDIVEWGDERDYTEQYVRKLKTALRLKAHEVLHEYVISGTLDGKSVKVGG